MKQTERILEYMKKNGSITHLEAQQELGVMRLGARIFDLKAAGVSIKTETAKEENRFGEVTHFARYRLETEDA